MLALRKQNAAVQRGFFLIEAMVALLIFALGILGLVAMGGTAVSAQSDAQFRTEASNYANAIASQIALNVNRVSDEAAKTASMGSMADHATGTDCGSFSGTATGDAQLLPILTRAAAALPGSSRAWQQIRVDGAPEFNRVSITLCWKTPSDNAARRHTLVTYVN